MSAGRHRCRAPTEVGEPCRAWPVEGSRRCVVHQGVELESEQAGQRCGAPTKRGGLCRNHPMGGSERCYAHQGLPPTQAEFDNPGNTKHGYFVAGFLDDEERELFGQVLEGIADVGELKGELTAAQFVRVMRLMRWEAEGKEISGFLNEGVGELRKLFESLTEDDVKVTHSWDTAEIASKVEQVLAQDRDLLVRLLPADVQEVVRRTMSRTR